MAFPDEPDVWCNADYHDIWTALESFAFDLTDYGRADAEDCVTDPPPAHEVIENAAMLLFCKIYALLPLNRCIIPLSPDSFLETDCLD